MTVKFDPILGKLREEDEGSGGGGGGGAVDSVNGQTGVVVLDYDELRGIDDSHHRLF